MLRIAGPRLNAVRGRRRVQMLVLLRQFVAVLPQRRHIVQNPECPPMRRHHQIVIFHRQIMHRHGGQIQLQWTPVRAIIERDEHSHLSSRVQQSLLLGILPHRPHKRRVGNSLRELRPGLAIIRCLENVRTQIIKLMAIDCDVRRTRIER